MQEYFVLHLQIQERDDKNKPFQIQLLDDSRRAIRVTCIGFDEQSVEIDGKPVPQAVVDAARRQSLGKGRYALEDGRTF